MDRLDSLLDSYYGLDEGTAQADALNLDASGFNVSEVASQVLSSHSLPELAKYSSDLVSQTKSLDREMQDLVYNNYNKFISATDTIKKMKESVGEMERAVDKLVTDMQSMGGASTSVNDSLADNRSKIEKLVGVKRLLLKLEFLFELPLRLKRSIELDAHAQAVHYYAMVQGVLVKYSHIPSLHKIRVEAESIIGGLKRELRGVIKDSQARVAAAAAAAVAATTPGAASAAFASPTHSQAHARVVEAIRLLVALNEPRPALRAAFLSYQKARLLSILHGVAGGFGYCAAAAAAGQPLKPTASLHAFMQSTNRSFLEAFRVAAELFQELFGSESVAGGAGEAASTSSGGSSKDALLAFTRGVFAEYFTVVKRMLSIPLSAAEEAALASAAVAPAPSRGAASASSAAAPGALDDDEAAAAKMKAATLEAAGITASSAASSSTGRFGALSDALALLLSDIRSAHRVVRDAHLPDRAHEVAEAILRTQLEGVFADARGDILKLLARLQKEGAEAVEGERAKAVAAAHTASQAATRAKALLAAATASAAAPAAAAPGGTGTAAAAANPFGAVAEVDAMRPAAASSAPGSRRGSGVLPDVDGFSGAAGASSALASSASFDWIGPAGAALSTSAEAASDAVSRRIEAALKDVKPLVLQGTLLLPDLARVFHSLVHGQVVLLLTWVANAAEAAGNPSHPSRCEMAPKVVDADIALERDALRAGGSATGSAAFNTRQLGLQAAFAPGAHKSLAHGSAGSGSGATASSAFRRRVQVDFSLLTQGGGAPLASPESTPSFLLQLALLCRHFAEHGIVGALSTMLTSLPTPRDLQALGLSLPSAGAGASEVDSFGAMTDVPDLIRRTQAAGRELLRQYAFVHAQRLSAVVRRAMASVGGVDWASAPEPRDVRLLVPVLLQDLSEVRKLVACTLGEWDARRVFEYAKAAGVGQPRGGVEGGESSGVGSGATAGSAGETVAHPWADADTNPFPGEAASGSHRHVAAPSNPFAAPATTNPFALGVGVTSSSASSAAGVGASALAPGSRATLRGAPSVVGSPFVAQATAHAMRRTGVVVCAAGQGSGFGSVGAGSGGDGTAGLPLSLLGGGCSGARASGLGGLGVPSIDMDRLFRGEPMGMGGSGGEGSSGSSGPFVLGPLPDFTVDAVLRLVVRGVFKALLEWTRELVLSPGGFKQIQVDVAALHLALPFLFASPPSAEARAAAGLTTVGGSDALLSPAGLAVSELYAPLGALEEALNEVVVSASDRCTGEGPGTGFDATVIYSLAAAKLATTQVAL